jgi:hypothetical protein
METDRPSRVFCGGARGQRLSHLAKSARGLTIEAEDLAEHPLGFVRRKQE